jgi:hypothetical protein
VFFPTPHHAVEYIPEQFLIVHRKDEERYREYRTQRLLLEAWERVVAGLATGNKVGSCDPQQGLRFTTLPI